jgi:hypothetical protein
MQEEKGIKEEKEEAELIIVFFISHCHMEFSKFILRERREMRKDYG